MNVEEAKKLTQEILGPDQDVSYITESLIAQSAGRPPQIIFLGFTGNFACQEALCRIFLILKEI